MLLPRTLLIFATTLVLSALSGKPAAQDAPRSPEDRQVTARAKGYVPEPPELNQSLPRTRRFLNYLPISVDLSQHFPPAGAQGNLPSCVGWAVGYARAYYSSAIEGRSTTRAENVPSASYIYNLGKAQQRVQNCLDGMGIDHGLRILRRGAVSLIQMPYDDTNCVKPSRRIRRLANQFRVRKWRYTDPDDLDTIKGELAKRHPVIFGMHSDPTFEAHKGDTVYAAASQSNFSGPHAMVAVGYDERRQAIKLINSWGENWGDRGYAWLDYETFRKRAINAFVMRPRVRKHPPKPAPIPTPKPPSPVATVEDLGLECAKVTVVSENGRQIAKGFVAKTEDIDLVRDKLKDRASKFELDVRPWPQCETLLTLDRSLSADDRPTVTIRGGPKTLKKGDPLVIDVISPRSPAHLHVAYIQADGSVVHLVQSDAKNLRTVDSQQRLVFGDGIDGRQRFVVRKPFGAEMIIALASRAPLFPEPRPQSESERDFLTALRRALLWKPDVSAPDRVVSAASIAIVTTEN